MNKKLLFNITEDWFFCSHFLERALAAKEEGYSIFVLCKENNKNVKCGELSKQKLIEKIGDKKVNCKKSSN